MNSDSRDPVWAIKHAAQVDDALQSVVIQGLQSGEELKLSSAGNDFRGRCTTRLLRHGGYIIKLRLDESGATIDPEAITTIRAREQALGVFHPDKGWFVANDGAVDYLGNICPELQPLNQLFEPEKLGDFTTFQGYVGEMLLRGLRVLARHATYLDISMSNFGRDPGSGQLYYLDDDLYPAGEHDFGALSESIAILFRAYTETPVAMWDEIGGQLRECLDTELGPAVVGKLANAIGDPPLMRPEAIDRRNALLKGLIRKPVPRDVVARPSSSPEPSNRRIGPKADGPPLVALLSDIHANVAALDAVLAQLETRNIVRIIVTGDVVGYGPDPGACVDRLMSLDNPVVVQGNHDHGAAVMKPEEVIDNFNGVPRDVLLWTQNVLSDEQKAWLAALPREVKLDDCWAMHGSPKDPRKMYGYVYVMTYQDNLDVIETANINRCFYGHTHVPGVYRRRGKQDELINRDKIVLKPEDFALINPGSVGQPRGGRPGAEFALLSEDLNTLEFFRIDYPKEGLFKRMRESGLPAGLEERILTGR
ncbi:MAG: metallophosphatase family protein [Gammaproteobacteria bacterium]|nr:metallophosphatase family protein [Gammaproteobacteria bacterium]